MSPIRISRESSFIVHQDKFGRIIGFHLSPDDLSDLNISSNIPEKRPIDSKICTYKLLECAEEVTVSRIPSIVVLSGEGGKDGKKALMYYKAEPADIEKATGEKEDETDCLNFVPSDGNYKGPPICGRCACIASCYGRVGL